MRAILFAVVALAAVCAVSGSLCPGVDCQMLGPIYPGSPNWNPLVNKLSAQHKEELFQANLDQLKTLSYESYLQLRKLLVGLEDKYDVYIKLSNALAGGHNARFKMIQGESDKVNILATELGIQVSDDSLYAPGEKPDPNAAAKELQATMAASAAWNKPEPPALIPFPERVNKFVSAQTIATLASSNRQQINQLNPPAIASMTRLIELLEANKNYVRLYGAIKLGHVVDYELINGSRTDLKKTASGLGLEVTDNTISTGGKTDVPPPPVNPQETGGDAQGFDADPLPNNNCGQALCPKRGPNEAEITIVPSVYIPPN